MKNFIKYLTPVVVSLVFFSTANAQVSIGFSINIAPPEIPEYVQPECPVDGYMWTPGYWAYGSGGYYWVPGAWVAPPQPGYLWTPGYWAFTGSYYRWNPGYWGLRVGYYGGINYGFGYFGTGFVGGMWYGNRFRYNTAVMQVNRTIIHNTYVNRRVIVNNHSRASYNGRGGVMRQPTRVERNYMKQHRIGATSAQTHYQNTARYNSKQYFSNNHGMPQRAAVNHSAANRGFGNRNTIQHVQQYDNRRSKNNYDVYRSTANHKNVYSTQKNINTMHSNVYRNNTQQRAQPYNRPTTTNRPSINRNNINHAPAHNTRTSRPATMSRQSVQQHRVNTHVNSRTNRSSSEGHMQRAARRR